MPALITSAGVLLVVGKITEWRVNLVKSHKLLIYFHSWKITDTIAILVYGAVGASF